MLDDIFEGNDTVLYEVVIINGKITYVLDSNKQRIQICKLSSVSFLDEPVNIFDYNLGYIKKISKYLSLNIEQQGMLKDGDIPLFTASISPVANISEDTDKSKLIIKSDNKIISFATNGDGSAGRNFVIHTSDFFLNTDRLAIQATDKMNYLYLYFSIMDIRKKHGYNRERKAIDTNLIDDIQIQIPKKYTLNDKSWTSSELQASIAKLIEDKFQAIGDKENTIDLMLSLLKTEKEEIIDNIFTGGGQQIQIADFLHRNKTSILLEDDRLYKRITIKMNNQGILLRDQELGRYIGTKQQFIIKNGQFLLSKIDARNGAFGIVDGDLNNAIITGNFWAYDIDDKAMMIDFFLLFVTSVKFVSFCEKASEGITGRHYLDEKKFLGAEIPSYSIEKQTSILESIKKLFSEIETKEDSLLIMKELLEIGREKILNGVFNGN